MVHAINIKGVIAVCGIVILCQAGKAGVFQVDVVSKSKGNGCSDRVVTIKAQSTSFNGIQLNPQSQGSEIPFVAHRIFFRGGISGN